MIYSPLLLNFYNVRLSILLLLYITISTSLFTENGYFDLTSWDIEKEPIITLDGTWEFYSNELLTPENIDLTTQESQYHEVPGFWDRSVKYGTYRLLIDVGDKRGIMGLYVPTIYTSAKIWVNGTFICSLGEPGANKHETIPTFSPGLYSVNVNSDVVEIIVQVASFHHRDGGIWESFMFGEEINLKKKYISKIVFDMFIFGALLIMGLHYGTLFMLRRKDFTSIYFAVLLLSMALRIPFVGQMLILDLFPGISWEITEKVSYLTFFLMITSGNMYIHSLYREEFNRSFLKLIKLTAVVLTAFIFVVRSITYIHILLPYQIFTTIVMLYDLYVLLLAIKRRRDGAKIIFLGLLALVIAGLNDILYFNSLSPFANLVHYGLFIFIFSQSYVLSMIFSTTFLKIEKLSIVFQKFIPQRFLHHVAKEGIEEIRLGNAEIEDITVLFTDIRDFTTLSESMMPQEVLNFLNSYLERITQPIIKGGGTIDKYMGDSIMALFDRADNNREQEAKAAVKAAINIFDTLSIYNSHRKKSNYDKVSIGLSIHSGQVIIGTIGSEDRMDSTVLGDVVNLTSRLESLTKIYRVNAIITETSLELVKDMNIEVRLIDHVRVKGKSQSVKIYEILDCCTKEEREKKVESLPIFNSAMDLYSRGRFQEAKELFANCQKIYPDDWVALIFINRCQYFIENKSEEDIWDGIYKYNIK